MLKFEPCACERHVRFITDVSCHEVATKEDAEAFLQKAYLRDAIELSVCASLIVEIGKTAMAENAETADPVVLMAIRDWNLQLATTNNPQALLASRPKTCLVQAFAA